MKNPLSIFLISVMILLAIVYKQSLVTNPYSNFYNGTLPFSTSLNADNEIVLHKNTTVHIENSILASFLRWAFAGIRISTASIWSEKPLLGTEQQIIDAIHRERFDPSKPYVISGGHFTELYLRNLGIFYSDILDPCIPSSQVDWENRQRIALQTVALDLALLSQTKQEPTTYSQVGSTTYTPFNVYTRASDSLYAVLDVLYKLQTDQELTSQYKNARQCHILQTKTAANILIHQYKPTLQRLLRQYQQEVLDQKTFLVKKDITLSSARDGIKRSSSFYDNVIAWKTFQLADTLEIIKTPLDLTIWKMRIIHTYWLPKIGIFIDQPGITDSLYYFSGDELMAYSVGFLDTTNKQDNEKLESIVNYIHNKKLDYPFPLHYAQKNQLDALYLPVKYFATSYMGDSIWSHWGIEYIKLLISENRIDLANKYIKSYEKNIVKYGGYPEVYDKNGNIFHSLLYKSVLHTGWVIDFEEAKTLISQKTL